MAKLSNIEIESPPIKRVQLKLANSEETQELGLRLLSVRQRSDVIKAAKAACNGVWNDEDPDCVLQLWIETVAAAAVDPDDGEQYATASALRDHPCIGQENILYLYEVYTAFEEDHCIRPSKMDRQQMLETCVRLAEGDDSPLDLMRLGTLRGFARSTAEMLLTLASGKLGSLLDESTTPTTSTGKPASASKPAAVKKTAKKKRAKR